MITLTQQFQPITAHVLSPERLQVEMEPCDALKPYIRCFWGDRCPVSSLTLTPQLVIPDVCMDLILKVNYTQNKIESYFVGISDHTFIANQKVLRAEVISTFGIRFYAWTAAVFADQEMMQVRNGIFEGEQYYSKIVKSLEEQLFEVQEISERILIAEKVLLENLHINRLSSTLNEVIAQMIKKRGNIKVSELAQEVYMSTRQLERLVKNNVGASPKQLASLMRYQYVWQEILMRKNIEILDCVQRYGYSDQAHLLHDFKRYHTMSPSQALQYAIGQKVIT